MRKQASDLKEQYFTDSKVARALIKYFEKKEGFDQFKLIIEPSAGNGNFLSNIPKSRNRRVIGFDIHPMHRDVKKQDFLKWDNLYNVDPSEVLCIGNPPFGRQSTLAKRFLNKCSEFSDHIVFILPVSFNTSAFKKSIPDGFTKEWSIVLDDDIFVYPNGDVYQQPLKTMFVYYRNTGKTQKFQTVQSNGMWRFCNKTSPQERNKADFRIVRASGTPGRAIHYKDPDFKIYGNTYNDYYIEILSPYKRHVKDIVYDINRYQKDKKWKFNNTTTFKSIDKNQVSRVLNKITSRYNLG